MAGEPLDGIPSGLVGGSIVMNELDSTYTGSMRMPRMVVQPDGSDLHVPEMSFQTYAGFVELSDPDVRMEGLFEVLLDMNGQFNASGGMGSTYEGVESAVRVFRDFGRGGNITVLRDGLAFVTSRIQIVGNGFGFIKVGDFQASSSSPINGPIELGESSPNTVFAGNIDHYGVIGRDLIHGGAGSINVYGDMPGSYLQAAPPAAGPNWGWVNVHGALSGTVSMESRLEGDIDAPGRVTVGKDMTGVVELSGGMKLGTLELNTTSGDTTGSVRLGRKNLEWIDVNNVVYLRTIHVYGNFTGTAEMIFRGCFDILPAAYEFRGRCIDGANLGVTTLGLCADATVTLSSDCGP